MAVISIKNEKDVRISPIVLDKESFTIPVENLQESNLDKESKDYFIKLLNTNLSQFSKVNRDSRLFVLIENHEEYINYLKELGSYLEDIPYVIRVEESVSDTDEKYRLLTAYFSTPINLFKLYGPLIAYDAKKEYESIYYSIKSLIHEVCENHSYINDYTVQEVISDYVTAPFEYITSSSLKYVSRYHIHDLDIPTNKILIEKDYEINIESVVEKYIKTKMIIINDDVIYESEKDKVKKLFNTVMKDFLLSKNGTTIFLRDLYLFHNFLWNLELSKYDSLTYNSIVFNININYLKCNLYEELKLLIAEGSYPYYSENPENEIKENLRRVSNYIKNLDTVLGISPEEKDIIKKNVYYTEEDIILNSIFPTNYILSPEFKIPYYKESAEPKPISFLKYYKLLKFEKESETFVYNIHYISSKIKHKIVLKLKEKYEDFFNVPSNVRSELKFLLDTSIYDKIKLPEGGEDIVNKYVEIYSYLIEDYLKNNKTNKIKISRQDTENFEFLKIPIFEALEKYLNTKYKSFEEFIKDLREKGYDLEISNIEKDYEEKISPYYVLLASLEKDIRDYSYNVIAKNSINFKNMFMLSSANHLNKLLDIYHDKVVYYSTSISDPPTSFILYFNLFGGLKTLVYSTIVFPVPTYLLSYFSLSLFLNYKLVSILATGLSILSMGIHPLYTYFTVDYIRSKVLRLTYCTNRYFTELSTDKKEYINVISKSLDEDYKNISNIENNLFSEHSLIVEKNFRLSSFIVKYKDFFKDEISSNLSDYVGELEEELKYKKSFGDNLIQSVNWYALEVIKEWTLEENKESSKYKLYYLNPKGISIINSRVPIDIQEDTKYIVDNILGRPEQKIEISSLTKEYTL